MPNLESSIQYIKGVGPKMAQKLSKVGIKTVQDLIFYYPRTWIDFSNPQPVFGLRIGQEVVVKVTIKEIKSEHTFKKRLSIIRALASDQSGDINLVWFNQSYLINNIKIGQELIISGKVAYDFKEKNKIIIPNLYETDAVILPIYPETAGLTSKYLRKIIKFVLNLNLVKEFLPHNILANQKLIGLRSAIAQIHFPNSKNDLQAAKNRLAFDELFLIILKLLIIKKNLSLVKTQPIKTSVPIIQKLIKKLPFQLTNAQKKASWEILQDLAKSLPMNRLLQGDVGSGKTIVAIMAALQVIKNGYQVVWMTPTEILANQHFNGAIKILKDFNISISLITGTQTRINNTKVQNKNNLKKVALLSDLVIGTHSLIQDKIDFRKLNLVIIDEQHRFGVSQRASLVGGPTQIGAEGVPHFLSMTATPIPRTLALSIYGDLNISVINEMPLGRQKIITKLVDQINRDMTYDFIRKQVKKGRQIFVICPLIEEKNKEQEVRSKLFEIERKSVKKEYEKLSKDIFPDLKIAMLHGKISSKEKDAIMSKFKNKEIDIIISTSVVEVGIDIPNASVMVIEDADRFGLSQLHQFRGRVGRGEHQSYCLLFTNSLSPQTLRRLKYMVEYSDGFKLAEKDLEIRGPGQLSGIIQHGLPDLKIASLTDTIMTNQAREAAEQVVKNGLINFAPLKQKLEELEIQHHLE